MIDLIGFIMMISIKLFLVVAAIYLLYSVFKGDKNEDNKEET